MVERWNKAVDEGKVHICTCIDMCGWQPCPYAGKELPEGCPQREYPNEELRKMDFDSLMNLYQDLTHTGVMTPDRAATVSRVVSIMKEKED